MQKKILCVVLTLAITFTIGKNALADTNLDVQKSVAQENYKQGQSAIIATNKKASDLESKLESLDNQIQQGMINVNSLNNQIGSKQTEMDDDQNSMEKAQADIKAEQNIYNERMKVMYTQGSTGYLEILLDSKGLGDFVSKVDIIKQITESDNKTISELNDRVKDVKHKKSDVEAEKQKLVSLKAGAQKQVDSMNAQKASQEPLAAAAKASASSAEQLSSAAKVQIASIDKDVNDLKSAQNASVKSTNRGGLSATGNISSDAIVTYAASFRGVNYLWGGTTPAGFDCSGFVQYVYAHFGVSIPRTSQAQFGYGTPVERANLQPGDLVFFHNSGSGPEHVGMYIGGGLMINAPHTGDVVKIAPLENGYAGARRVR